MRIVQTFWSSYSDPTMNCCGWKSPEYNLMSWALSCCSLREHYDEVVLYTDSKGYDVLINKLHLPYSEVHVVFDNFKCLPYHWALAKIYTYSLQEKPFLHVDGDIYISKPFCIDVMQGGLIAQNKEKGTQYYGRMLSRIMGHRSLVLPKSVSDCIEHDKLLSYNMGVFGGSDLEFIQKYCHEAFTFMNLNRMNDTSSCNCNIVCNLLFEQILFGSMVEIFGKDVSCIYTRDFNDNGYSSRDFCDLSHFEEKGYFHILGGHKKKIIHNEMVAETLYLRFPDYHQKVLSLFSNNQHISDIIQKSHRGYNLPSEYEEFLIKTAIKWSSVSIRKKDRLRSMAMINKKRVSDKTTSISINPYVKVIDLSSCQKDRISPLFLKRFCSGDHFPLNSIVMVPSLWSSYVKEIPVLDLECDILSFLNEKAITYDILEKRILESQGAKEKHLNDALLLQFQIGLKTLIKENIVFLIP